MSNPGISPNVSLAFSVKSRGALQTPNDTPGTLVSVLARISDKCCSLDMIRMNGNLPIGALDVIDTDKLGASDLFNVVLKVSHRPGLADKVFVCASIIDTETRLTIFSSFDGNGRSRRVGALLYYIIVEHILNTLIDHGFSAWVSSIRTPAHRFGTRGKGKRCFGSVILTQLRS